MEKKGKMFTNWSVRASNGFGKLIANLLMLIQKHGFFEDININKYNVKTKRLLHVRFGKNNCSSKYSDFNLQ